MCDGGWAANEWLGEVLVRIKKKKIVSRGEGRNYFVEASLQCHESVLPSNSNRYPCCGDKATRSGAVQLYSPGCCTSDHQVT